MYQNGSNTTEQRWADIQQHAGYSSHAYMRPRGSSSTLRRREQNLPMSMPWNQNFQIFVVGLPEWLLMKILHGHETWIFITEDLKAISFPSCTWSQSHCHSFLFFFFSIWLNGYLMNCFSGTDRQSTTCSKVANSVVASSTLLGDIGSSSSSEMRGFNLGLSYPKEAMWNINAFY